MKKYLFMLGDLPPAPSANGICVERILRHLYNEKENNINCILWSDPKIQNLYKYNLHFIKGRRNPKKKNIFCKLIFRIKYVISKFFLLRYFPVSSLRIAKEFYKKAIDVIKKENITHIIAVSFPGETLYAINKLKKKYGKKIVTIIYPLDVSIEGDRTRSKLWNSLSKKGASSMMNRTIKINDYVLTLENSYDLFQKSINSKYHYKFKSVGIPMIENLKLEDNETEHQELIVLYAGYLLPDMYNPIPILDLINKGLEKSNKRGIFDFYGVCDKRLEEEILSRYKNLTFVNHGWVQDEELNKGMTNADAYLNISKSITNTIPSKVFKYMCFKKPILHYYFSDDDCCIPYLEKYKNTIMIKANSIKNDDIIDLNQVCKDATIGNVEELFPTCTPKFTANVISGLEFEEEIKK